MMIEHPKLVVLVDYETEHCELVIVLSCLWKLFVQETLPCSKSNMSFLLPLPLGKMDNVSMGSPCATFFLLS